MEPSPKLIEYVRQLAKENSEVMTDQETYDAAFNLLGFFTLLLKIDIRLHPENYKKK